MFDIKNIKENNDYIIFFKIVEKQHLEKLVREGQVYFSLLSTYRELQKKEGKTSVGDKKEGLLTKKVEEYLGFRGEYHQVHGPASGYTAVIDANQCAFCCYAVGLKEFVPKDSRNFYHRIPYSTIEKICKDKGGVDNCVLLAFDVDVVDRICDKLYGRLLFCRGKVLYDDYYYVPQHDIRSLGYALECCFHKSSEYEYQNEFRIVAINNTNRNIDNLYIEVDKKDFSIIELKENHDFYCHVNVEAKEISGYANKRQAVWFAFSFDLECENKNGEG